MKRMGFCLGINVIFVLMFIILTASSVEISAQEIVENENNVNLQLDLEINAVLPSSYDGRSYHAYTQVKEQGNDQICWAYSTITCAEVSAMKNNLFELPDFSEYQLAFFLGQPIYQPMGICGADCTYYNEVNFLQAGGNNRYTTFALANWVGIANQEDFPNQQNYYENASVEYATQKDVLHMQNAKWIDMENESVIKKLIMQYGCVISSYYNLSAYFNEDETAYYNPLFTTTNHSITLIGWDDSYSRDRFKLVPEKDGAWLVRGSWGTERCDEGYYWISYCDKSIMKATAFVFEFESADNYDHNYFYDGSCGTNTNEIVSGGEIANIFSASANERGADESLEAVGFAVADAELQYEIQIFKDLKNPYVPNSGKAAFVNKVTGTTDAVGYYTVKLPKAITLYEGEVFSVVITLKKEGASFIHYFVDETYQVNDWIGFENEVEEGQSFENNNSAVWTDLAAKTEGGQTARIKAYTKDLDTYSLQDMNFDKKDIFLCLGDNCQLLPNLIPVQATLEGANWYSADDTIAIVANDGTVTACKPGKTEIVVKKDTIQAHYEVHVNKKMEINSEAQTVGSERTPEQRQGLKKNDMFVYGNGIYKVLNENNLCVTYVGAVNRKVKMVVIPNIMKKHGICYKVTAIEENAFKNNKDITKVVIGDNVEVIGKDAFSGSKKLTDVKGGKDIVKIEEGAFGGCKNLKTVAIGSKVEIIGDGAFEKCISLTKITIPAKVNKIGKMVFNGCKKLKMIIIKTKKLTMKNVSKKAFKGVGTKTVVKVLKSKKKTYTILFRKKGLSKKVKIQ